MSSAAMSMSNTSLVSRHTAGRSLVRNRSFGARSPARAGRRGFTVKAAEIEGAGVGTTTIEFVKGTPETSVPDVKLTRSKDGTNGTAFFRFAEPDIFDADEINGEITGMFLTDAEGTLETVDVNAKFINGTPSGIEATLVMKSTAEWNRFMRFMERYAEDNGLGFKKN